MRAVARWSVSAITDVPRVTDGEPGDPDWHALQHYFGIDTFGANVFVATRGDETLVGEHDESGSGQQELYVVLEGEVTFELDGQTVAAPRHTAVAVVDPGVRRSARAVAPGTMLLAIGASDGQFRSTWNASHFTDLPTAHPPDELRFTLRGRAGRVAVRFAANDDPSRWGLDLLQLPWPADLARGLPVIEATVAYDGEGYGAAMGWIQVVRIHVDEHSAPLVAGAEKAPAGEHLWVDVAPSLRDTGVPFVSFGARPVLFDAPVSTESRVRFVADSFLTASDDALISRRSRPFFGLRWGYATDDGPCELLPPVRLEVDAWREALPVLRAQFAEWEFEPDWFD